MNLLEIAFTPAVVVTPKNTVRHAVEATLPLKCYAAAVMENREVKGIITSQDVLRRVVLERKDPQTTLVGDVMTAPVKTLHPDGDPEEALKFMLDNQIRHIPLSEDGVTVCGMLSMRKLLAYLVEDQKDNLDHLEAFLNADGMGG